MGQHRYCPHPETDLRDMSNCEGYTALAKDVRSCNRRRVQAAQAVPSEPTRTLTDALHLKAELRSTARTGCSETHLYTQMYAHRSIHTHTPRCPALPEAHREARCQGSPAQGRARRRPSRRAARLRGKRLSVRVGKGKGQG